MSSTDLQQLQKSSAQDEDSPHWRPAGAFWTGIDHLLRNAGPLSAQLDATAAEATQTFLRSACKLLVIGAGGLGCELLKDVALSGFRNVHVIDLDTIDVTNLNRQFLFSDADVGQPKATVAARAVNAAVLGASVVAHHANIMDFDRDFYRQFNLVIGGLDSIDARRWLNAMLVSLVEFGEDGQPDQSTVIPFIDGGTEGLQGQARVILPRISSCFECTLSLFPPARTFPLCTIANTPRLPEHCVEYARVVLWERDCPFGKHVAFDGDDDRHLAWLHERAAARAAHFGIAGVSLRLTVGVAKNVVPAVASTNAVVAAMCANEALKLATGLAVGLDNYAMYNGSASVYTYAYRSERKPDCPVCGTPVPRALRFAAARPLGDFVDMLGEHAELRARHPLLRAGSKTLFAAAPKALRDATERNLSRSMVDVLGSMEAEVVLTDRDLPFAHTLIVSLDGEGGGE